jgi:RHS repeat-associated protein
VLKRKEYQGFDQVGEAGELKTHVKNDWAIDKSGYVYIFTSNESEETNVLFDNLQVMQVQGNLIQVDHYYPFGLVMDGISGQGPGKLENKYKFGGKELQHQEFSDGSGLEEYDFGARYYDPQLGVWHNIDPLADINRRWSPYNYVYDNPLRFIDPDGMESRQIQDFNGNMQTITDDDDVINVYTAPPDKKDDDQKDGDDKSGDGSIDKGKEKVYRDPFYMPQPGEEDAVFKVRQKYNNINILKDKLENLIKELSLIAAEPAK